MVLILIYLILTAVDCLFYLNLIAKNYRIIVDLVNVQNYMTFGEVLFKCEGNRTNIVLHDDAYY